jgi:hypothetical protein
MLTGIGRVGNIPFEMTTRFPLTTVGQMPTQIPTQMRITRIGGEGVSGV